MIDISCQRDLGCPVPLLGVSDARSLVFLPSDVEPLAGVRIILLYLRRKFTIALIQTLRDSYRNGYENTERRGRITKRRVPWWKPRKQTTGCVVMGNGGDAKHLSGAYVNETK